MAESEEELNSLLMKVKKESEKWLKTQHSDVLRSCIRSHHFLANIWGNNERFYFLGLQNHWRYDCSHDIKSHLLLGRKDPHKQHIKKQRHYFAYKGPSSQSYGFSSSHLWI